MFILNAGILSFIFVCAHAAQCSYSGEENQITCDSVKCRTLSESKLAPGNYRILASIETELDFRLSKQIVNTTKYGAGYWEPSWNNPEQSCWG